MKNLKSSLGAATLASLLVCASPNAGAQELTERNINNAVDRDDDSGKWGMLGLLGLLGLMGLKRRDHDNHSHSTSGR